jgi:hypothetical protein
MHVETRTVMNRISRRIIMFVLLIVALAIMWNLLGR